MALFETLNNETALSDKLNKNFRRLADGSAIGINAIKSNHIADVEDWTDLAYTGGFEDYSGLWDGMQYRKDSQGIVHMRGLIKRTSGTGNIGVLPAGYRPAEQRIFAVLTSGEVEGRIDIASNGTIIPVSLSNTAWITLYGITFKAEQ